MPSNYRLSELDASIGSVQSQLSESFKNLYHQALNASLNSSMAFHPQMAAPSTGCAADSMLQHAQNMPSVPMEHQPGPSHAQLPLLSSDESQGGMFAGCDLQVEKAVDWFRQAAAAAESQSQPPPPPAELFQSLDMGQFQSKSCSNRSCSESGPVTHPVA